MASFSQGLSELVLVVTDVQASALFYREVVGLEPESEAGDEWAWFRMGAGVQRLGLRRGPLLFEAHSPHPAGSRWGPVHFALQVARDQFQQAVEQVRASQIEVYGPTRFEWMAAESYYFYDPDGNLVEWWSPDP